MKKKHALVLGMAAPTFAGIISYGICQAGCSAVVVACYSAAGFVFGTVAAGAAPPAIIACNAAFGTCQAKCALAIFLPV